MKFPFLGSLRMAAQAPFICLSLWTFSTVLCLKTCWIQAWFCLKQTKKMFWRNHRWSRILRLRDVTAHRESGVTFASGSTLLDILSSDLRLACSLGLALLPHQQSESPWQLEFYSRNGCMCEERCGAAHGMLCKTCDAQSYCALLHFQRVYLSNMF